MTTTLDAILEAGQRQLSLDDWLAEIEAENRVDSPQTITAVGQRGAPISPEIGPEPHQVGGIPAADWDGSPPENVAAGEYGADHGLDEVTEGAKIGPVPHNGDGLEPGASVGHADFANFRAVYVGPGKDGKALVRVVSGWTWELPAWPVPIPYNKLEVLT